MSINLTSLELHFFTYFLALGLLTRIDVLIIDETEWMKIMHIISAIIILLIIKINPK